MLLIQVIDSPSPALRQIRSAVGELAAAIADT
jgi:hypothetical protein